MCRGATSTAVCRLTRRPSGSAGIGGDAPQSLQAANQSSHLASHDQGAGGRDVERAAGEGPKLGGQVRAVSDDRERVHEALGRHKRDNGAVGLRGGCGVSGENTTFF